MEHREKIEHFPELLDYRMFNSKLELKRFVIEQPFKSATQKQIEVYFNRILLSKCVCFD